MSVASRSSSPEAKKPFVGLRSAHRRFVSASVCEPGTAYGTFLVTISFLPLQYPEEALSPPSLRGERGCLTHPRCFQRSSKGRGLPPRPGSQRSGTTLGSSILLSGNDLLSASDKPELLRVWGYNNRSLL